MTKKERAELESILSELAHAVREFPSMLRELGPGGVGERWPEIIWTFEHPQRRLLALLRPRSSEGLMGEEWTEPTWAAEFRDYSKRPPFYCDDEDQ
jgi:hypothetical protein